MPRACLSKVIFLSGFKVGPIHSTLENHQVAAEPAEAAALGCVLQLCPLQAHAEQNPLRPEAGLLLGKLHFS